MPIQRKWGITRDEDGTLSFLTSWPWFWRYPSALVLILASIWLFFSLSEQPASPWLQWGAPAILVLFALCFAYEAGCLVIVLIVLFGAWIAFSALFPAIKVSDHFLIALVAAGAYYAWFKSNSALDAARANSRAIEGLRQQLTRLFELGSSRSEDVYAELQDIEARIDALERDALNPFGDPGDAP